MLVILVTFAVLLGIGFGQSNETACPTLASQLRDVLAKYNQQQSRESSTKLMQLLLVKQLTTEMDLNTPTAGEDTTCNCSKCKAMNATIAGSDLTGVIEAMNATINKPIGCQGYGKQASYS